MLVSLNGLVREWEADKTGRSMGQQLKKLERWILG
jgi:hypothetical protein